MKRRKLKPYYNSFKDEGLKELYKSTAKNFKYPYIEKYGYGLKKFADKLFIHVDFETEIGVFDYRVGGYTYLELEQKIKKFCIGANTLIPKDVSNTKKKSRHIYNGTKTKFTNPRQLNKKLIVKYVEEYKNDI
jgi:hypothetical protein